MSPKEPQLTVSDMQYLDPLWQQSPVTIALVGAGGKTSIAFWLARCAREAGKRVLLTTTTHMFLPEPGSVDRLVIESVPDRLYQQLVAENHQPQRPVVTFACRGCHAESNKVYGLEPEFIDRIKRTQCFDVIVVEADGARRHPLKAPDWHEPCLPHTADVVLGITSGETLLQPLQAALVHRWPLFCKLTGASAGDCLDKALLTRLLAQPNGLFKGAAQGAQRIWVINKADRLSQPKAVTALAQDMLNLVSQLDEIWLTAMHAEPPKMLKRFCR